MEKRLLAILMAGLMLATVFGAFSVNAAEYVVAPLNIPYGVHGYVYDADTGESDKRSNCNTGR